MKCLTQHSADPYKALLNYTATPLPWCSLSPTKLLMGISNWKDLEFSPKNYNTISKDGLHFSFEQIIAIFTSIIANFTVSSRHISMTPLSFSPP